MKNWIGTSGWSYDHWNGVLYPEGTPSIKRLDWYIKRYNTVELNSSAYHWPRDTTFVGWRDRLPPGFMFTVKAPRGLTHAKKLRDSEVWINRMAPGLASLEDKRGVLLVQLPPDLPYDLNRLETFLGQLPKWLKVALEFRHLSWHQDSMYALLERYGAAYCVMSGAGLPCVLKATADFAYVRLHGPVPNALYGGSYSDDDMRWWAERIREWNAAGHEVFAYFNNDGGGNAVRNADTLKRLLEA